LNEGPEGFLFIDKPEGPSSFAIVSAVRRAFKVKRVGHGGTLDPAASGLLVVALGSATRLIPYAPLEPKTYRFGLRFGLRTDTLDGAGTVVESGGSVPARDALIAALPSFCGNLMQVPPEYSAVKVGGVRAYRMARRGVPQELASRPVSIRSLNLLEFDEAAGEALLEATCSGGTYVRSLARDLAQALGTCGYAASIRRTALGPFQVAAATPLSDCTPGRVRVIPSGEVLGGMARIEVGEELKRRIFDGRTVSFAELSGGAPRSGGIPRPGETPWPAGSVLAVDSDNTIVAILEPGAPGHYHPERVFNRSGESAATGSPGRR